MSGGEPSSIKQNTWCAAGQPVLSRESKYRAGVMFDSEVYGLFYGLSFAVLRSFYDYRCQQLQFQFLHCSKSC